MPSWNGEHPPLPDGPGSGGRKVDLGEGILPTALFRQTPARIDSCQSRVGQNGPMGNAAALTGR